MCKYRTINPQMCMRLPHAWVHVPAGAQNMLSHLIDADTHKYTPFCSTSANQGRRFQKARACWVKNTSLCLDAFWSWHLVPSLLIFSSWYLFHLTSLSLGISFFWHLFSWHLFLFDISFSSRLVSWNLSLDMSNTSPQQLGAAIDWAEQA